MVGERGAYIRSRKKVLAGGGGGVGTHHKTMHIYDDDAMIVHIMALNPK